MFAVRIFSILAAFWNARSSRRRSRRSFTSAAAFFLAAIPRLVSHQSPLVAALSARDWKCR